MSYINQNYYLSIKDKIMKNYDKNLRFFKKVIESRTNKELAKRILNETKLEYEKLIPKIPFIGGGKNRVTGDLINSTTGLAFSKVMKKHHYSNEDIISMLFDVMKEHFNSYSKYKILLIRFIMLLIYNYPLNKLHRRYIKKIAEKSQKGEFSDNLVFHYVEGEGKEFDFGIDYVACPICNFWRDEGMGDILPYVCLWDFFSSEITGSGLVRTMTLSEGCEKCDFRFKWGRKPENRQKTNL